MTLFGLILGVLSIFGSFLLEGGNFGALLLIPALIIVFGGTAAAAIVGSPREVLFNIPSLVKLALFPPTHDLDGTIKSIVNLSTVARREGILSLEEKARDIQHPFFRKMIMLAVDGIEPDVIRSIVENEVDFITERHKANAAVFQRMGGYSPTMGIIGTVMGLISTLANAGEDATTLVKHIASAFIATLWGVFMANLVYLPIADRLKAIHAEEMLLLSIIMEGITSIQSGENPSVTSMKLYAMLPSSVQSSREKAADAQAQKA